MFLSLIELLDLAATNVLAEHALEVSCVVSREISYALFFHA